MPILLTLYRVKNKISSIYSSPQAATAACGDFYAHSETGIFPILAEKYLSISIVFVCSVTSILNHTSTGLLRFSEKIPIAVRLFSECRRRYAKHGCNLRSAISSMLLFSKISPRCLFVIVGYMILTSLSASFQKNLVISMRIWYNVGKWLGIDARQIEI